MDKITRISKWIIGSLLILILLLCCNAFKVIPWELIRTPLTYVSDYAVENAEMFYYICLALGLIYIALELIRMAVSKKQRIDILQELKTAKDEKFTNLTEKQEKLNSSITDVSHKIELHKKDIECSMKNGFCTVAARKAEMRSSYSKNLSLYHSYTGKLCSISMETHLKEKFSDVVKEYSDKLNG